MAVRQASCWRLTPSHCLVMAPVFAVLGPPWHVLCDQFREVAVAGFFLSLLDDQKLLRAECGLIRQPCSSLERTTRFDVQCVGRLAFVLPTWFPLISTGVWLQPCRLWFAKAQPGALKRSGNIISWKILKDRIPHCMLYLQPMGLTFTDSRDFTWYQGYVSIRTIPCRKDTFYQIVTWLVQLCCGRGVAMPKAGPPPPKAKAKSQARWVPAHRASQLVTIGRPVDNLQVSYSW